MTKGGRIDETWMCPVKGVPSCRANGLEVSGGGWQRGCGTHEQLDWICVLIGTIRLLGWGHTGREKSNIIKMKMLVWGMRFCWK